MTWLDEHLKTVALLATLSLGLLLGACDGEEASDDGAETTLPATISGTAEPGMSTSGDVTGAQETGVVPPTDGDDSNDDDSTSGAEPSSSGSSESSTSSASETSGDTPEPDPACPLDGPPSVTECESGLPFAGPGECDPYGDGGGGCAGGQKCLIASYNPVDGTLLPDARCVPVVDVAVPDGGVCQRSFVDGVIFDNCGADSMCYSTALKDGSAFSGVCRPTCGCGAESPTCAEGSTCSFTDAHLPDLRLCLPSCDPLDPPGMQCAPGTECRFSTTSPAPNQSIATVCTFVPEATPQLGEPCQGNCAEGTLCTAGTCKLVCDATSTEAVCPDAQTCIPLFFGGADFDDCRIGSCN